MHRFTIMYVHTNDLGINILCTRVETDTYPNLFETYYLDSDPEPFRIVANYFKQF